MAKLGCIAQIILLLAVGAMIGCQLCAKNNRFAFLQEPCCEQELAHKQAIMEPLTFHARENDESDSTIERNGLLIRYKDAQATIVILNGFMCDRYDAGFLRTLFERGKFNFLTFDFRAHGQQCEGQYCTFGKDEIHDVMGAVSCVKNHPELKDKPVYAYAFSMGAVSAIRAQAQSQKLFDAMILDCPFDSSETIVRKGLESLKISLLGYQFNVPGKSFLEKYAFHPYVQSFVKFVLRTVAHMDTQHIQTNIASVNSIESIEKIKVPCFFIHCKQDDKVPVDAIKNLYTHAGGQKRLWLTNGRRHFDSIFYNPEKYAYRVHKFLSQVMNGSIQDKQPKIYEDIEEKGKV